MAIQPLTALAQETALWERGNRLISLLPSLRPNRSGRPVVPHRREVEVPKDHAERFRNRRRFASCCPLKVARVLATAQVRAMKALPRGRPSFKHALVLCDQKRLTMPPHRVGHLDDGFDQVLDIAENQAIALRLNVIRVADVVTRICVCAVTEFVPQDRNKKPLLHDADAQARASGIRSCDPVSKLRASQSASSGWHPARRVRRMVSSPDS